MAIPILWDLKEILVSSMKIMAVSALRSLADLSKVVLLILLMLLHSGCILVILPP